MEELLYVVWLLAVLGKLPEREVLVVGDSEAGYASRKTEAARSWFDTVHVDAKGGTTIEYWGKQGALHRALGRWRAGHPGRSGPDVVVLFLGTNDHWRSSVPDTAPIFQELGEIPCVWVGPTAVEGRRHLFTQLLELEVSGRCRWVSSESLELEDGWHPVGGAILPWLQEVWSVMGFLGVRWPE